MRGLSLPLMNTTFLSVVYFIAFSHALMLAVALWLRSEQNKPGRILAVVMAILAYKLFEGGASYSGLYKHVPHLLDLMPAMVMLLGPVFYGYVRKVTGQTPFTWGDWAMHLAPWLALWIFLNSPSVFRAAEQKIAMWDAIAASGDSYGPLPTEIVLRLLAIKAHLTTYLILSSLSLLQFSGCVKHLRSDNSGEIVTQLKGLTISFITLEATWVSLFLAQQYLGLGTLSQVSEIWLLLIGVIVLTIGFVCLKQPDIIFTKEERLLSKVPATSTLTEDKQQTDQEKVKYIHSVLSESAANEIANQIEATIESKQLYLNDKLKLTDLSKVIGMKSHTISQVINQHMKTNFYRLINSFRVQHTVGLLEDDNNNWSIERVALESGFSNRVTFNKAFKEHMNCTASEYKKKHRQAS